MWAVAALEQQLLLELVRIVLERDGSGPDTLKKISRLERLTGGRRLRKLRTLELPSELDQRIGDAIDRRNRLVHEPITVPEMGPAALGQETTAAVQWLDRLALDCGELATELHLFAVGKLEALTGHSPAEMVETLKAIDLDTVTDPVDRQRLEVIFAIGDIDLSLRPSDRPPNQE